MEFIRRLGNRRKSSLPAYDDPPNYLAEDALQVLKGYDIVFLVDDSGSMVGSRWNEAGGALAGVARIASQYDPDGIDIHFLNSPHKLFHVADEAEVRKFFMAVQPYGPTPTGDRLNRLLNDYLDRLEYAKRNGYPLPKPVNFIVITDGVPTDDPKPAIIQAARRLDAGNFLLSQLGIQFIQVGNDSKATKALKEMDNKLSGKNNIRDMVDTTPYKRKPLTDVMIIKILLGGINRRVDNLGGASVLNK